MLRGAGFAFHRLAPGARERQGSQAIFGLSSLLTPFFMGTVVGAVASGRVPIGNAEGDPVTSWLNAASLLTGALFVATSAYLAAVFLVSDSRRAGDAELERYFAARALGAALAAGALALAGIFVFRADARYIYDGLVGEALPLVILSAVCGLGVLALLRRGARRGARALAVGAVAAVIWAWGVAQYPYLLPETLTISAGAADDDDPDRGPDRVWRRHRPGAAGAGPAVRAHSAQRLGGLGPDVGAATEGASVQDSDPIGVKATLGVLALLACTAASVADRRLVLRKLTRDRSGNPPPVDAHEAKLAGGARVVTGEEEARGARVLAGADVLPVQHGHPILVQNTEMTDDPGQIPVVASGGDHRLWLEATSVREYYLGSIETLDRGHELQLPLLES